MQTEELVTQNYMAIQEKIKCLQERLDEQIEYFSLAKKGYEKNAFHFRVAVVLCSASTTILLGLHTVADSFQPIVKDCALILSALVSALSTLDAFYNHRALWIRYKITSNALKAVRSKLEYLTASGLETVDEAKVDQLFEEFQEVLSETDAQWLQLRKETESKHGG